MSSRSWSILVTKPFWKSRRVPSKVALAWPSSFCATCRSSSNLRSFCLASPSPNTSIFAYCEKSTTMVLGGALVGGGVSALAALWGLSDLAGESAAGWGAGAEEACWAELSAPLEDSNALGASGPELCERTNPCWGGTASVGGGWAILATPLVLSAVSSFS